MSDMCSTEEWKKYNQQSSEEKTKDHCTEGCWSSTLEEWSDYDKWYNFGDRTKWTIAEMSEQIDKAPVDAAEGIRESAI